MKTALTFTTIAGGLACDSDCPICISKMTPSDGLSLLQDWEVYHKALKIALSYGAKNLLITGKGEPLLAPVQVTEYLIHSQRANFVRREIQTNGHLIPINFDYLRIWKALGLDLVAISIFSLDNFDNTSFMNVEVPGWHLGYTIGQVQRAGLKARITCNLTNGNVDSVAKIKELINFCKENNVFQLTLRDIDKPANPTNPKIAKNVDKYKLSIPQLTEIQAFIADNGVRCDVLPHGATIYEVFGQNVCITTCMGENGNTEDIRDLIFFPKGWLTTSWQNVNGGRIL